MKPLFFPLLGALAFGAGLAGCSSKPDSVEQAQQANEAKIDSAHVPNDAMTGVKKGEEFDADFLPKAASGGMLEVKLGQEVAQRATTPEVKSFAQRMVTDHTRANDQLKALAAKKNITLPTTLGEDQQKVYNDVLAEKGLDLDKKYVSDMLEDHKEDVKAYQEAVAKTGDADVRAFAQGTLPVLEAHLGMVQKIKPVVDAKK